MKRQRITFQIGCHGCRETFTLDFTNQKADWRDYAMAVNWQIEQKCPVCKKKKLYIIEETSR